MYLSINWAEDEEDLTKGKTSTSNKEDRRTNIQVTGLVSECVLVTDTEVITFRPCLREVKFVSIPKSIQHPQII